MLLFTIFGFSRNVEEFLLSGIPLFVLIFAVLFILLAKLLNSALTALPLAIISAAAAAALIIVRHGVNINARINVGDLVVILGITVVVLIIYVMMKLGVVPVVGGH